MCQYGTPHMYWAFYTTLRSVAKYPQGGVANIWLCLRLSCRFIEGGFKKPDLRRSTNEDQSCL